MARRRRLRRQRRRTSGLTTSPRTPDQREDQHRREQPQHAETRNASRSPATNAWCTSSDTAAHRCGAAWPSTAPAWPAVKASAADGQPGRGGVLEPPGAPCPWDHP
ncbi:hypothetical protein LN042_17230 [Kitasatospora sp. RB6PN24]|uniref:hypothetical protein n=1 Tax=Kitasatospora humi TaxID=2893891 RepID=UPI001E535537|nr:hypothetical protein [Kitasatospora humi]MCC9308807.1 hypothetical protein [Kitasatospora humi]